MASTPRYPQEYLEPVKYDPCRPTKKQKEIHEGIFSNMDYELIANTNPFTFEQPQPDSCEEMKERESYFPPALFYGRKPGESPMNHSETLSEDELHWKAMTPSFRNRMLEISYNQQELLKEQQTEFNPMVEPVYKFMSSPESYYHTSSSPLPQQKRSESQPVTLGAATHYPTPRKNHVLSNAKSFSDNNFFENSMDGQQQTQWSHPRQNIPKPLMTFTQTPSKKDISNYQSSAKRNLSAIEEHNNVEKNYKVEVRETPESQVKIVRSPMKKLFGEHGLLGHSSSSKDQGPKLKKNGLAQLSNKFKERIEEMKGDFALRMPSHDNNQQGSTGSSRFPISLSPYTQADMYMRLELLLTIECNRFLMNAFTNNQISLASMKRVTEAWSRKGRPQVLAFRYDSGTQRELVLLNIDTLPFKGQNAVSRIRVESVLACWGVLAREMSVRTFCQPDSAVKKHLHDAERVFQLLGVSSESMVAVQDMKARIFAEITKEQAAEQELERYSRMEE